jgi:hypothetical protein
MIFEPEPGKLGQHIHRHLTSDPAGDAVLDDYLCNRLILPIGLSEPTRKDK